MLCIELVNYWDKYPEMHGQQNVKIFFQFVYVFVLCTNLYSEAWTEVFSWPRAASIHVFTTSRSFVSNALVHSTKGPAQKLEQLEEVRNGIWNSHTIVAEEALLYRCASSSRRFVGSQCMLLQVQVVLSSNCRCVALQYLELLKN